MGSDSPKKQRQHRFAPKIAARIFCSRLDDISDVFVDRRCCPSSCRAERLDPDLLPQNEVLSSDLAGLLDDWDGDEAVRLHDWGDTDRNNRSDKGELGSESDHREDEECVKRGALRNLEDAVGDEPGFIVVCFTIERPNSVMRAKCTREPTDDEEDRGEDDSTRGTMVCRKQQYV